MRVGVLPHDVSGVVDGADEVGAAAGRGAEEEERGRNVVASEEVEQGGRRFVGAVVEGEVERARSVVPPPEEVGEEVGRRARGRVAEQEGERAHRAYRSIRRPFHS